MLNGSIFFNTCQRRLHPGNNLNEIIKRILNSIPPEFTDFILRKNTKEKRILFPENNFNEIKKIPRYVSGENDRSSHNTKKDEPPITGNSSQNKIYDLRIH